MTSKTLEEVNKHFRDRKLYTVDSLDIINSRSPFRRWNQELIIKSQFPPTHLRHSQAYIEKYFPKDTPGWKKT